jgi:broad specificity phosphatase PhoE
MFSTRIVPTTQQTQTQKREKLAIAAQTRRRAANGGGQIKSKPTFGIVRVFLTHHGRLACLVNHLLTLNSTPGIKKPNRIYLKNNSVVKVAMYFVPDSQMWKIEISLVYDGTLPASETSKPKYMYWSLGTTEDWQTFLVNPDIFAQFFPGESENSINYFMRHGQAVHNQFTALQKWFKPLVKMVNSGGSFWDSLLISNNGIKDAALYILDDLKFKYSKGTVPTSPSSFHYFSSPMRRCLETMFFLILFLSNQDLENQQMARQVSHWELVRSSTPTYYYSITILPCLHELSSVKPDGKCDKISNKLAKTSLFTPENASRCLSELSSKKPKQQKQLVCSDFTRLYPPPPNDQKYKGEENDCDTLKNRNQKVNCTLEKLQELMELLISKSDFKIEINWSLFKLNLFTDCTKTNFWSFIHNPEPSSSPINPYITQL